MSLDKEKKLPDANVAVASPDQRMRELQEENRRLAHEVDTLKRRLEDRKNAALAMDDPKGISMPQQPATSELMHLLLASAQDIIMVLDQDGRLITGSGGLLSAARLDSFDQIHGLYVKDLYLLFGDRAFAATGEEQFQAVRSGQRNQTVAAMQTTLPSQEGRRFYTVHTSAMGDAAGNCDGVLVVCHDATADQHTHTDLYSRLILDSTPLMCTLWDEDCNLLDCNQETVRLLGLKDKAEYITHFYTRIPAYQPNGQPSRSVMMRALKEALNTGYSHLEWTSRTATDESLPLEMTVVRVPWQGGYRLVCYAQDRREFEHQRRLRREAEERDRLLLDSSPLICNLWDAEGNLLDCNQEAINVIGLKDKAEIIDHFFDRNPACQPNGRDTRSEVRRIIGEALEHGYLRYEWMSRTATGELLPLEGTAVRIPWEGSYRILCYTRDLRETKEQERRVREAEHYAKILLDATPLGAILWDKYGTMLHCNQEALRLFGYSSMEALAIEYKCVLSPPFQPDGSSSAEKLARLLRKTFETGFEKFEWMHYTASGDELPVEKILVQVPWQGDWHVAAYNRDLREIKAQERQLREAEEHAGLFLDSTPLGTILWDKNGTMLHCNQETLRLFGYSSKESFAAHYWPKMHPPFQPDGKPSQEKLEDIIRKTFDTGFQQCEWTHLTASGDILPVEKIMVRVPWKGGWHVASYNRDLREIKAREQQLRKVEERTGLFFDSTPLGAVLWDENINMLFCNQETLRLFGYSSKESLANDYWPKLHPPLQSDGNPSQEKLAYLIRKTFDTGFEQCDWTHLTASGDELPVEKILVRVPWKDGWAVASYNRDMSAVKAEERQKAEAEERGRLLLDFMPMGASLWSEEGSIRDCNLACLRIFDLAGKSDFLNHFYEFSPECQPDGTPTREKAAALLREAVTTGYKKVEWMHCTLSGEAIPAEITLVRIPWKGGWWIGAYIQDLREHVARQEAEERARILLDSVPMGIFLLDRERNLLDCNQMLLHMFGFPDKNALTHATRFHLLSPEFQPDGTNSLKQSAAAVREAFATGYNKFEWLHRTLSEDEPMPTEVTLIRIPWKGDWCVVACIRDLREAKAHEQQMRQAYEHTQSLKALSHAAQIASQAKSEFLARMSHELRTPLNAIIGFLSLEVQKELPQETIDNLEIVLDASHNLLTLINDILDISKIEAGRFELTGDTYHLTQAINEVIAFNSFRMESKLITFRLEMDESLPSQLNGDILRIKQVLNNLLSNAFKYTEGGIVTLSVEPAARAPGEEVPPDTRLIRFSIRDTGRGIKAENLKKLFTSYTRFDSKTNRLIEGTGLGLAISKNLVEMMGGQMEVESEYKKGSSFSCIIPQVVVDPTPIGHVAVRDMTDQLAMSRRSLYRHSINWRCSYIPYAKVLVVDDVPTNLAVAKAMLQRYSMAVDCVASGQESIDLIRSEEPRYNAVFMDHMMPGMDGVEALHRIRAIDSDYARSVPVIILTANVISGNKQKFLEQGFQAFLGKPINPAQLDAVISRWVKDPHQKVSPDCPQDDALPPYPSQEAEEKAEVSYTVEGLDIQKAVSRFGSEAVFFDVLRSYAANTPQVLDQMRHLVETDLVEYGILAHGMKGSSYSVEANALGDMAKELEYAAKNQDWPKVRETFPAFLEIAEKLLRDIDALLRELMPAAPEQDKPLKPAPEAGELTALYEASLSCAHSMLEAHLHNLEQYRYQSDGDLVTWLRMRVDALDYDLISERLAKYAR
ncbi:MAG: PAS domain S-box protein [Desulfobulbus sp.]|nr:PAS domain S-box protein [Desulfobulbus sp.]